MSGENSQSNYEVKTQGAFNELKLNVGNKCPKNMYIYQNLSANHLKNIFC